ncbi:MAG: CARDB domain-containing protein [Thermoplasmata archaeon]
MKDSNSYNKCLVHTLLLLLAFMLVSNVFMGIAQNTKASRTTYQHITGKITNNGLYQQQITLYTSAGNFDFNHWPETGGSQSISFSIPDAAATTSWLQTMYAKAKDGSTAVPTAYHPRVNDEINLEFSEIGLTTAYLKVYATNTANTPVTFSVERMAKQLATFTVKGSSQNEYVGKLTEDEFFGNAPINAYFRVKWGDNIVYDSAESPSRSSSGITWGAGVGGPNSFMPSLYVVVGTVQPTLTGKVTPSSGDSDTQFNFSVVYKNTAGYKVQGMVVNIDGQDYTMINVGGSEKTGVTFTYNTALATGTHQYHFSARWEASMQRAESAESSLVVSEAPPKPEPKFELSPPEQYGECRPNRTTTYRLTVTNTGDGEGTVTLSAATQNNTWIARMLNNDGTTVSNVLLKPGDSKTFVVNITVSANATKDQIDKTTITARVGSNIHSTAYITTIVPDTPNLSLIVTDINEKTIKQGAEELYSIRVTNEYDQNNNVTIFTSSLWNTSVLDTDGATPLPSLNLSAGESMDFYVKVTVPDLDAANESTYGGASVITNITALSNTLNKRISVDVMSTIETVSDLNITIPNSTLAEQTGKLGKELTYALQIINNGNAPAVLDGVTASCTGNWSGKIKLAKDSAGTPLNDTNKINGIDTGTVPVGGESSIIVKLTMPTNVPDTAKDGDSDILLVWGKSSIDGRESNATLIARIETPGIEISPKIQVGFGEAGETVPYYINIYNHQKDGEEFDFRYGSSKNSQATFFDINDIELDTFGTVQKMLFQGGEKKMVVIKITLSNDSAAGSIDNVTITVTSRNSGKSDQSAISTIVLPSVGIGMSLVNKTAQGSSTIYFLNITNLGNAPDTINIQCDTTLKWNSKMFFGNDSALSDTNGDGVVDVGELLSKELCTIKLSIEKPSAIDAGLINRIIVTANSSWNTDKYRAAYPTLNTSREDLNTVIDATISSILKESGQAKLTLNDVTLTDISVDTNEIYVFSESGMIIKSLMNGTTVKINATIRNIGTANLNKSEGVKVEFYIRGANQEEVEIGNATIYQLPSNSSKSVGIEYFLNFTDVRTLNLSVRTQESIMDVNLSNNLAEIQIYIKYIDTAESATSTTLDYLPIAVVAGLSGIGVTGAISAIFFRRRELL